MDVMLLHPEKYFSIKRKVLKKYSTAKRMYHIVAEKYCGLPNYYDTIALAMEIC